MPCSNLKQLFSLYDQHNFHIGSLDVVRAVCNRCDSKEACPSVSSDEYDASRRGDQITKNRNES